MSEKNKPQEEGTQTDEFEALYAQTAAGMAYADGRLTLNGMCPDEVELELSSSMIRKSRKGNS